MKKEQVVRKEFNYDQDNTKLNFTLRVDIKKELQNFLKCLNEAVIEVEAELEKLDNDETRV